MSKFKRGDKVVCVLKESPDYFNDMGEMDYLLNEGAVLEVVGGSWDDDYVVIDPKHPDPREWFIEKEHLKLYEEVETQGDVFTEAINKMVKEELKIILKEILDKL